MSAGDANSLIPDFTSLDQESIFNELEAYAQRTYTEDQWTDFNLNNEGTRLMELVAVMGELLAYTQNARLLETIPVTARRERNFVALAKSYGFQMKSATVGSTVLRIYNLSLGSYSFVISRHQQFSTLNGVVFQPIIDQTILSSGLSGPDSVYGRYIDIDVISGKEVFQEYLGVVTGQPGQVVKLQNGPLIDGTLTVYIGSDVYTRIENATYASPSDKVFTQTTDDDGLVVLKFGDGTFGQIPPVRNIIATYKVGAGVDAAVTNDVITQVLTTADGSAVSSYLLAASVTNLNAVDGAGPRQTLANAKENLPVAVRANGRGVTDADYAALAVSLVPGILKAIGIPGRYQGGSSPVLLVMVPASGDIISPILYNQTVLAFRGKKMSGKRVIPTNPIYVELDILVDIYVQDTASAAGVENLVRAVLLNEYARENTDFAAALEVQHAYDVLRPGPDLPGFNRVFYRRFTVKPYAARYVGTSTTGSGSVIGIKVDGRFVQRREWNIVIVPPAAPVYTTRFEVRQRHLGRISQLSDTFVFDEEANFLPNELLGWELQIRPLDNSFTQAVLANNQQTITTQSGLLLYGTPDDAYVVQKLEGVVGKVLGTTLSVVAAGATSVTVTDSSNWEIGDGVLVISVSGAELLRTTITGVGSNVLTLADPLTGTVGATLYYLWRSADKSVEFAVVQGVTAWTAGDQLFVDTFSATGDHKLRPENFIEFTGTDLSTNTVGGIR